MPTANVTVKDFWLPEGKKRWVLKAQNDQLYGVPAELQSEVKKNGSYKLTFKVDHWNGKDYLVVQDVQPATAPIPSPATPPSYSNNPGAAVMGMVNQFIGRGDVPCDEKAIANVINKCKRGYEASDLGPKPAKSADDLDDEIPY